MKKYIFRLIIFLISWSIIYKIYGNYTIYKENSIVYIIKDIMYSIISGKASTHLWFIYAIIGLYILTPILRVFTKNATKKELQYAITVGFIFSSISVLARNMKFLNLLYLNLEIIKKGIGIGFIEVYLIGHYLDKYDISKLKSEVIYCIGIICFTMTIVFYRYDCIKNATTSSWWIANDSPNMVLSSIAVFLFFKNHMNREINNALSKLLKIISKRYLGIYGVHVLILWILNEMGFWNNFTNGFIGVPFEVIFTLCISLLISWFLSKIPLVGKYIA